MAVVLPERHGWRSPGGRPGAYGDPHSTHSSGSSVEHSAPNRPNSRERYPFAMADVRCTPGTAETKLARPCTTCKAGANRSAHCAMFALLSLSSSHSSVPGMRPVRSASTASSRVRRHARKPSDSNFFAVSASGPSIQKVNSVRRDPTSSSSSSGQGAPHRRRCVLSDSSARNRHSAARSSLPANQRHPEPSLTEVRQSSAHSRGRPESSSPSSWAVCR
mmetsp:Transcript_32589/g.87494  ORF Transcript_32589/g.87494 Transcript_32589/m.87494 type:complete len:219 (-) Transcript_32589:219-875(-)